MGSGYLRHPDNNHIVFAGVRDGVWNIYAVSRRTKEVTQLIRFTTLDGFVRYPAWSPHGNRIVFARAQWNRSLWTLKLPQVSSDGLAKDGRRSALEDPQATHARK